MPFHARFRSGAPFLQNNAKHPVTVSGAEVADCHSSRDMAACSLSMRAVPPFQSGVPVDGLTSLVILNGSEESPGQDAGFFAPPVVAPVMAGFRHRAAMFCIV